MARALNATGRPIIYSCSWPAYQGGLPPKVSAVPLFVVQPVCYIPLTAPLLMGHGLLPGFLGHSGFLTQLADGSVEKAMGHAQLVWH